ncbi:hypothetical protein FRC12_020238 [Ceratobasidium sp. 428]|nr:hypothetical protein FRC12_020238 [Ceratobasidium sp. 428]
MPMLWNLVPVIRGPRFSLSYEATSLSLNRSGTLPLDLALMIPYFVPNSLMADLTKHASRFRSINIVSQEPDTVQDILRPLLEHNTSSSLSELSLCVTQLEHIDQLGDEPNYMFPPDHESSKDRLPQLLQSLTRLRFNGATFDWAQITFSTRLVELRIHSVFLGYDSFLHEFLRAISAASELQQLSLASIT